MCKLFIDWENEIKAYCAENGLDFEKAKNMPKCWGKNDIWLQYHDPDKGKNGLRDETPAPIVLKISRVGSTIKFEQTEHTKEYLM